MIAYADKVLDALGIVQGPSHMEIMVNSYQDPSTNELIHEPCLVEVGSRCHGGEGTWLSVAQECIGYTQVRFLLFGKYFLSIYFQGICNFGRLPKWDVV
jgi:hypothetical protein